jgi:hypothetical protein
VQKLRPPQDPATAQADAGPELQRMENILHALIRLGS